MGAVRGGPSSALGFACPLCGAPGGAEGGRSPLCTAPLHVPLEEEVAENLAGGQGDGRDGRGGVRAGSPAIFAVFFVRGAAARTECTAP